MAIQLNFSKIEHKEDALLDPAYVGALERGMVMVYSANVSATGASMVVPCSGTAGEVLAGLLWFSETSQESVPLVETLDIPALAPLTVSLKHSPLSIASIRATNADTGAAITVVAGAPGAGQLGIVLATRVITADAALAGVSVVIVYRYAITAAQLAAQGGRRSVNQGAERLFNQVTLCKGKLDVQISNFDTGVAYDASAAGAVLRCGAGGMVTSTGAGTQFAHCSQAVIMHQSPGISQAFVGVECQIA